MLRVLALTRYGNLGASSRVRMMKYIPELSKFQIDIEVSPLFGNKYLLYLYNKRKKNWFYVFFAYIHRLIKLCTVGSYDILWIEKELFPGCPAIFEFLLAKAGIVYLVDYDDAIFHNYDNSKNFLIKKCLSKKIDQVMFHSSLVICGNQYIAQRACSAGAKNHHIIPTVVDLNSYPQQCTKEKNDRLRVGWIGTPSTIKYLEAIIPAIRLASQKIPLELCIVGASLTVPDINIVLIPWEEHSEIHSISTFDIGIMPLQDSLWERGKCGYKLIQYMALSLPVIASPVGVNTQIVQHNKNGLLAETIDDWVNAITFFAENKDIRLTMGRANRLIVEEKYNFTHYAKKIAQLLLQLRAKA
ncbi:MAG: glycosyltransferase family 4 protein [Legionella sp.]